MRRIIFTGVLAAVAGVSMLAAQQAPPAQPGQAAQPAQPAGPAPKSPEEAKALQALFSTQDPDAMIKAADEFLATYSDTQFKEHVLTLEAEAYNQKGDWMKAQIAAEDALKVNPKSIRPNMLVGQIIAQHTGERDLDKTEKLAKADKSLNAALESLNGPKPNPTMTDQQWNEAKAFMMAEIHNDLGLVAIDRKNYDGAISEFKEAVAGDPTQGAYEARLASAYQSAGKNNEAIAECDKMLANPQLHPQIRQFVTNVRNVAVKAGGQPATRPGAPPAAPPAEKK